MAALLIGTSGAGFAGYKYIYSGESTPNDLAAVIPANASIVAYISNEPAAWAKLQNFGTPAAKKIFTAQLKKIENIYLAESKIDFKKDIQPWLGNAMFASLPNTDAESTTPHILIVIGIKDKLKAQEFATKLKAQSKESSKILNYKGIEITESGKDKQETFTAFINDRLIIAPEKQSLELAIDTVKGQPSITNKTGNNWFRGDTFGLKQPIAAFYVPNYAEEIQKLIKADGQLMDIAALAQMQKIQSFGGAMAINDVGIRLKLVIKTDGTIPTTPNISSNVISGFPADTFMLFGGTGLSQSWTELTKIAAQEPGSQKILTQMRESFTQSTQLDLDKDVFSWMGGDYTMGMIPINTGITAQAGFGGVLTIDSTDRAVTDNTINKIVTIAKGSGLTVEQRQIGSTKISDVRVPGGLGTIFSYGWPTDKSISIAVGDGLMEKIANHSSASIIKSSNFTTTMGAMPDQKQGFFYTDIEKVYSLVNSKLGATTGISIPDDANVIISSMQGLGMNWNQPDKETSQFEALLALKPASK
jgi:Protein of unknown function (DUF3352)